jgi:hypothetical protein
VALRKLDSTGSEVFFSGFNGYERDGLAKGWLRASHRELARRITQPAAASVARPYSDCKAALRRNCATGNRNLSFCHTLRSWLQSAGNRSRP